jgi:hypothetical protein
VSRGTLADLEKRGGNAAFFIAAGVGEFASDPSCGPLPKPQDFLRVVCLLVEGVRAHQAATGARDIAWLCPHPPRQVPASTAIPAAMLNVCFVLFVINVSCFPAVYFARW